METTLHPSGCRAGATWVAAVGAFLLVFAAAVFVAVQWSRMTASARLGLVLAVTAACVGGGRWLRRSLPATGDVLFHLGAFLLPVDLAAAVSQTGLGWRALVLAEGLLGAGVLGGLGLATGSVVLVWAGILAAPVLAGGVAAYSPVGASVALGLAAVAAELGGRGRLRRVPPTWAAVAGLAPLVGAAASLVAGTVAARLGEGTLADLGLTAGSQVGAAPVAGVLAAVVLGRQARRREAVALAFAAMASVAVGAGTALLGSDLRPGALVVELAAAFALVEVLALAVSDDPFWARPLQLAAAAAEVVLGGASTLLAALVVLAAPDLLGSDAAVNGDDRVLAAALAVAALAWVAADQRRYWGTPRPAGLALARGGGWVVGSLAAAACGVAAVELASGSGPATAAALAAFVGAAVACRRAGASVLAAGGGPWAVLIVVAHPLAGAVVGIVVVAATAVAAVRRSVDEEGAGFAVVLSLSAVGTAVLAAAVAAPGLAPDAAVAGAALALWLLAALLDRGRGALGDLARAALLLPAAASVVLAPRHTLLGVALAAFLLAVDALRSDRPEVACGAAVVVQALVAEVALAAGLPVGGAGLALCVGAVAWGGLAAVVDDRWRLPFLVAVGAGSWAGVAAAAADAAALSSTLLVVGSLLVAAGVAVRRPVAAHAGGVVVCFGLAGHLAVAGVSAPEPYLAPVAAQLLVAGWRASRGGALASWAAYGPPVVLLGGVALAERLAGGGGGHALAAGAVGVAAVAVGGWRRLLGPLLVGTALVVVLTVHESLSALAGVPTWAWLATAGALLLAVGVALERSDSTPGEAGRRLVDVLSERYG